MQLTIAANAGAIMKAEYLWRFLSWSAIHIGFMTAGLVGFIPWRNLDAAVTDTALGEGQHPTATSSSINLARHGRATAILHSLVAASILFLVVAGGWMMALPWGSARGFPWQLHKNLGMTVIALMAVLLSLRLWGRRAEASLEDTPTWMRTVASADHILLYVLVFAVGLSGYLSSAFSGWSTTLWWAVDLPNWAWKDEELNALFSDVHVVAVWTLLLLVAAHIAGALYHAVRRDRRRAAHAALVSNQRTCRADHLCTGDSDPA